jgi:hypothetical protein
MPGKVWFAVAVLLLFCVVGCGTRFAGTGASPDATTPTTPTTTDTSCPISIRAVNANIDVGNSVTLRVETGNCSPSETYWAINGIQGGDTEVGTISSSGVYTAPAYPPVEGQVNVSVSASSDMSNAASITLNIFDFIPASEAQRSSQHMIVPSQFFGMHIRCSGTMCNSDSGNLTQLRFGSMRLWDNFHWAKLEPARGVYEFAPLDQLVAAAQAQGVSNFIFTLGNPPAWAAANQDANCTPSVAGTTCQVPDVGALDEFLQKFVQHYCGKISTYEIWNEPDQTKWLDSVSTAVLIANHVSSIARNPENCGCTDGECRPGGGTNPNLIAGPALGYLWNTSWLKAFFKAGGGSYLDVNSVHTYGYLYTLSSFPKDYDTYHTLLKQYSQDRKPVLDSETDWGEADPLRPQGDDQLASWLIKFLVLNAAKQINSVSWYAYNNCLWGTLWGPKCGSDVDKVQGLRKTGIAYGELYKWLANATLQYCDIDASGDVVCRLTRANSYDAWIVWAGSGSELHMAQGGTPLVQIRDQRGTKYPFSGSLTVSSSPLLVESTSAW